MKFFYYISTILILIIIETGFCQAQNFNKAQEQLFNNLSSLQANGSNIDNLVFYSKNTEKLLDSIYWENSILKNGKFHNEYYRIKGNPFLFENKLMESQISINGRTLFTDKLNYDIYGDLLVYEVIYENKNISVILNEALIDEFSINDKVFINCSKENNELEKYYELIHKGKKFRLLAKWKKGKASATQVNEMDSFTEPNRTLILINENNFTQIRKTKDVFKFFNTPKTMRKKMKKTSPKRFSKANSKELDSFISQFDNI